VNVLLGNTNRLGKIGHTHTSEAKALMSEQKLGNTNRLGTTHTAETKAAISAALSGRTHSAEAKAAISAASSVAIIGNTNAPSMSIYFYDHETRKLVGEYSSQIKAASFLGVSRRTLQRYLATPGPRPVGQGPAAGGWKSLEGKIYYSFFSFSLISVFFLVINHSTVNASIFMF